MLLRKFPLDGHGALYEQLARVLKRAILEGHFHPGDRLPATRVLSETLGLSRNTVLTAYEILRSEQLTTSHERSVTRVADVSSLRRVPSSPVATPPQSRYAARLRKLQPDAFRPAHSAVRYDLHYNLPWFGSEVMRAWNRRLVAAARVLGPRYADPVGYLPLRRAIVEYLARRRGVDCSENDILIVGGVQQAVTLVARVVLDEGDAVAIEDPHYSHLVQALNAHGARTVSIRTDGHGLVTTDLPAHNARLTCVTPSHQFPSGAVMTLDRRLDLLNIASRQKSWILEDDYDSEFHYRGRPLAALRSLDFAGRVIYVGTFSKTVLPSLRLAFIVCPAGLREDLRAAKRLDDWGSPLVPQVALASFIRSRQLEKKLRKVVAELDRRCTAMLEGLRRHGGKRIEIRGAEAGAHLVVWLTRATYADLDRLIDAGLRRGIALYPIHRHYVNPPERPGLAMGYANLPVDVIPHVCELFGKCLDDVTIRNGKSRRRLQKAS